MISDACPVQWTGRQAVVPLPEHIGLSNAGLIREELLSVINPRRDHADRGHDSDDLV
jgi:hypothetical protein